MVDGDLYLLTGDDCKNKKGFYVTPFYCIENILLDRASIIKITEEEDIVKTTEEVRDAIDFDSWILKNKLLLELFIEYAVCKMLKPDIQTVGYSVSKLISSGDGLIDIDKTNSRITELRDNIINSVGQEMYDKHKKEVCDSIEYNGLELIKYVSGKDYLYPLMEKRIRSITKTKSNLITLKQRIASICDIQCLNNMPNFVFE